MSWLKFYPSFFPQTAPPRWPIHCGSSPNGDPETPGVGGANAENEQVFDDLTPAGEPAGQCRFTMTANALSKLTTTARALVFPKCGWQLGALGNAADGLVAATFDPADGKGQSIAVTYGTMPTRYNHFGKKTIAMSMDNTEFKWYQDVEFFFHYAGTGGRTGANPVPNWFFYWSQIKSATAAPGNGGFSFRHGAASAWIFTSDGTAAGTTSRIEIGAGQAPSLSAFIGITAHEQKHEDDFWREVWGGTGYNRAEDADFDGLRDAWETAQYENLAMDLDFWLETTAKDYAWSDVRADIAAKDAVNANLGIDALDWSDRIVPSGRIWEWEDDNPPGPPVPSQKQTCETTTHGNNKNF